MFKQQGDKHPWIKADKRRVVSNQMREVAECGAVPCEAIVRILDFSLNQEEKPLKSFVQSSNMMSLGIFKELFLQHLVEEETQENKGRYDKTEKLQRLPIKDMFVGQRILLVVEVIESAGFRMHIVSRAHKIYRQRSLPNFYPNIYKNIFDVFFELRTFTTKGIYRTSAEEGTNVDITQNLTCLIHCTYQLFFSTTHVILCLDIFTLLLHLVTPNSSFPSESSLKFISNLNPVIFSFFQILNVCNLHRFSHEVLCCFIFFYHSRNYNIVNVCG